MTRSEQQIAAMVVKHSGRDHPADAVLREALAELPPDVSADKRAVATAVFAYFRWFRWLNPADTAPKKFAHALELDERLARDPASFTEPELRANAVPHWLQSVMDVPAAFLRALQSEPKLWLRARPAQGAKLAQQLGHAFAFANTLLSDAVEYCGQEDLFKSQQFQSGQLEVQDLSSQAVSVLCAPNPGETWWDACAGEGGKTLHLADLMRNKGLIWASDRSRRRLALLRRRAARAKMFNYRAEIWEGGAKLPTKTRFDGVLVDAPCTGIGGWQKNPHARWTTTPKDVQELSAIQLNLLSHAAVAVKPAGKLIYAVCTLSRAETTEVADNFERSFAEEFEAWPVANPLSDQNLPAARQWFWPQDHGGIGMFVALWRRRAI